MKEKLNRSVNESTGSTATTASISTAGSNQLNCIYCQNELNSIWIECNKCSTSSSPFYLCLKCFSMSAEIGTHRKDHDYRIKSQISHPIFNNEHVWSFKEENLLLTLLEQYGFGNWDEISKNFDSTKNRQECMQHYYAYFIYGNIGKYSFNSERLFNNEKLNIDHTKDTDITVLLPPIDMSIEEQRALGYMPLRDDFEREFKNDAECLLSNLVINNDDDDIDLDIKLTLTKMYRDCLLQRQKYKHIARDYGLVNNSTQYINKYYQRLDQSATLDQTVLNSSLLNKNPTTSPHLNTKLNDNSFVKKILNDEEINKLHEKYKKFAQFCTVSTYETLLEDMRKRLHVMKRLNELKYYRDNGLTKYKDVEVFNGDKLKREQQIHKARYSPIIHSPPAKRSHLITNKTSATAASTPTYDIDLNNSTANSSNSSTTSDYYTGSLSSNENNQRINSQRLCSMPGYNLLSDNEKKLILTLNMKPNIYITFKTYLIKNNLAQRQLRSSAVKLADVESVESNNTGNSSPNGAKMHLRRQSSNGMVTKTKRKKLLNSSAVNKNFYHIPRPTRKRIIRFLYDNGWLDFV